MKKLLLICIAIIAFSGCNNSTKSQKDSTKQDTIEVQNKKLPDTLDYLLSVQNEAELIEIFGQENIKFDTVYGEEGATSTVTLLFPETKDEINILWKNTEKKEDMAEISHKIFYNAEQDTFIISPRWKTSYGISIGMTLKELIALNEAPISLMGFGWDYEGMVTDMHKGKLAELPLSLQFSVLDYRKLEEPKYKSLMGDMEISSDNALVQELNPVITAIKIIKKEK